MVECIASCVLFGARDDLECVAVKMERVFLASGSGCIQEGEMAKAYPIIVVVENDLNRLVRL